MSALAALPVVLAAALEGGARALHRLRYALPYTPRIFGDYPYREFVEKAPAPLDNRLKPSYSSRCVSLNRYGLRGPEPDETGRRKRLLVIGESEVFGVKLPRERDLWSVRLGEILESSSPGEWEVLNGGHPGYNSTQHRALWESGLWDEVRPNLLLLRFGGNDLSLAYAMGESWTPEAAWPIKFLWAMNSVQPMHQRLLLQSCLYYLLHGKKSFRRTFGDVVKPFLEENRAGAERLVLENHEAFIALARRDGIPVAVLSDGSLERCLRTKDDLKSLDALNEGWRAFSEGYGPHYEKTQETLRERCSLWGVPYVSLREGLASQHLPARLFFDGVHWNAKGQQAVANFLFREGERNGWWSESNVGIE